MTNRLEMDDVSSPVKDNNNTTHPHVERTANTAVSSNLAIHSDDENAFEDVFDYGNIQMLRSIKHIDEEYTLGRVIG